MVAPLVMPVDPLAMLVAVAMFVKLASVKPVFLDLLIRVHLLYAIDALVENAVYGRGDCKRTTDDSAETDKEAGEGLGADFAVDDFHGGDVLGGC